MKASQLFLPLMLVFMAVISSALHAGFKKGETYHGFKLLEKRFVKEVNAECLYFEHVKSGARLLKIAADDPNKTFGIGFKTVPNSDCGTPHIIEHSVLNGSRNYPVKSPFDVLSKGSLKTFLNAFTGSDRTFYPFASMNDKDYFNLMHIYLDAVFNPLIYSDPRILKQEGWHYELESPDAPVVYKGVVYNEMKGAYSDPERELGYQANKVLFPDNGYRFSSGGYPSAIPKLTYEDFLAFHKKHYHPVNSHILLYGNADLDKELEVIDSEYLSKFEKEGGRPEIPLQKPFDKMKDLTANYSIGENDKTEGQTYLSLSFVAGLNSDQALVMALNALAEILVNQEAAPIRLALQKAGIGKEVGAYTDDIQQNVFQIVVQNANEQDKDKFRDIVLGALRETAEKGLDKKVVEGTLNRMEFQLREGNDAQKGLTYLFQALPGWFFADDPFLSLEYEKPLAELKTSLTGRYLENIIQKYLIDNPHSLLLTLVPKPGLEKENTAKMNEELAEYKKSLSPEKINALVQETKDLVAYQKREDTPEALATMPLLERKDINPKAEFYTVEEKKVAGVPVLSHEEFSNKVDYLRFMFDMRVLPGDLLPYAGLLTEVLGSENTDNYSYGDLDLALNTHTGGFRSFIINYLEDRDDNKMMPKFVVDSKAMNTKTGKLFELASEIVNHTRYKDTERLKDILVRYQSRLESQIKQDGRSFAYMRLQSYFTKAGGFREATGGFEYYWFISDLAKNFDKKAKEISENLAKTAALLFTKDNMIVTLTAAKEDYANAAEGIEKFIKTLPEGKNEYKTWTFDQGKKNEGFTSASKVQFVLQGYDFKKLGYSWNGKMRVLDQVLSTDYLHKRLRVIGGAYGGYSNFSPEGGVLLASYRDPNLKETLDNYMGAPEYLDKFEADEKEMTRFIIGTVSRMDMPYTPSQKGNIAVKYFLEKTKPEDLQKERDEVLSTTAQDIRGMKKLVSDVVSQKTYCVYGNEEKLKSQKDLFGSLENINRQ
ncbi:MAG TPA: insulinase family protein [Ignavibacteriales bacterium]|nr:insulinase family protein [Ignavibacteriales bacterium]